MWLHAPGAGSFSLPSRPRGPGDRMSLRENGQDPVKKALEAYERAWRAQVRAQCAERLQEYLDGMYGDETLADLEKIVKERRG